MTAPILIVGQGIAGATLGWEFERAGFSFEIADAGLAGSATRVAAGVVNPITGQRFVKNWRIDSLLEPARKFYREVGEELGENLVREVRIRRLFSDEEEFARGREKAAKGSWAPFVDAALVEREGFWINGGFQVDPVRLLEASRERWIRKGILTERRVAWREELKRRDIIILCSGADGYQEFGDNLRFERAKGEVLEVAAVGAPFEPGLIRSEEVWVVPRSVGQAQVGSTYDREAQDLSPSSASRELLEGQFRRMYPEINYRVESQLSGWRMSVSDRRPVVGRVPAVERLGLINGLSSKGVLTAPWIARQWVNHLAEGIAFDEAISISRCWRQGIEEK